jgi:hypothetical protein
VNFLQLFVRFIYWSIHPIFCTPVVDFKSAKVVNLQVIGFEYSRCLSCKSKRQREIASSTLHTHTMKINRAICQCVRLNSIQHLLYNSPEVLDLEANALESVREVVSRSESIVIAYLQYQPTFVEDERKVIDHCRCLVVSKCTGRWLEPWYLGIHTASRVGFRWEAHLQTFRRVEKTCFVRR